MSQLITNLQRVALYASLAALLSSCSSQMQDSVLSGLSSFSVSRAGQLSFISNTTTERELQCVKNNRVVLQISAPPGSRFLCRDLSALEEGVGRGPVCEGGVSIVEFPVNNDAVPCREITLCGVAAKERKVVGKRFDGGDIEELSFDDLPWGCRAKIQSSENPNFPEEATKEALAQIVAPKCPFCESKNKNTCLPCDELGDGEVVVGGVVIPTTCSGSACKSCMIGTLEIKHGEGHAFFEREESTCSKKCAAMSVVRICNNGLFEGDAKYGKPSCFDTACGCSLPGVPTVFDSGTTKVVYKKQKPECGQKCEPLSLKCDDGKWMQNPTTQASVEQLATYSAASCTEPICNCERTGRLPIINGATGIVYSKATATCLEKCSPYMGQVKCTDGKLTEVTAGALAMPYDRCEQESCGCKINVLGSPQFIDNNASRVLYSVGENSIADLEACDKPENKVTFTCKDTVLTPAYNPERFKHPSCVTKTFGCTYKTAQANLPIAHGAKNVRVYKTSSPSCDVNNCESELIQCDNGVIKKMSDNQPINPTFLTEYPATSCTLKQCDCTLNGFVLPHKGERTFWSKSTGECDPKACDVAKQTLRCVDGKIEGGDPLVYQYPSCEVKQCRCALPTGANINSGEKTKLYVIDKATCANPNACNDAGNSIEVTCSNGMLSSFDESRYKFMGCAPPTCGCTWAGVTVTNGQKGYFYSTSAPAPGMSCDEVKAEFTCGTDGKFSGSQTLSRYPSAQCKSDVDEGTFGGTGGGNGNDEGPGSAFRKRSGLGDGGGGGGEGCQPGEACSSVGFSALVEVYKRRSCVLPWGTGEVEHYASVIAFKSKCVVKPAKCSAQRQVRTCHFKGFSGSDQYRYSSCEEKDACP